MRAKLAALIYKLPIIRGLKKAIDENRKMIESLSKENQRLQRQLEKNKAALQAVKGKAASLKQENKALKQKLAASEKRIRQTREDFWAQSKRFDERIKNTDANLKTAREELQKTKTSLDTRLKEQNEKFWKAHRDSVSKINRRLQYKIDKYMPEDKYQEALCDWYYERTGNNLNLEHPETFNEIIQWTKLFDFDDEKCKLVDKYLVRDWVREKIGERYLIPLLGVWDRAEDIDFEQLPQSFVLKCNHGCGYNIIVKDKSGEDFETIRKRLSDWLHEDFGFRGGFELQYTKIKRRIIAEEYMENEDEDLYDYKVFCFNGKAKYIMFISNRKKGVKRQFYDLDWNLQPFVYDYELGGTSVEKPGNLSELIACAEKLAQGFIQVRVDFYRLNDGTWKFGEMTFTSCSGNAKWNPPEYDRILGEMIEMPMGVDGH